MKKENEIPTKLYYSISDIATISGLETHVLRYWGKVFTSLKPHKKNGVRRYTRDDIELILFIKYLLYDKNYTIKGASEEMKRRDKVKDEESKIFFFVEELKNIQKALED